ncbi:MAG: hypothetical protein WAM78_20475 [Candidatus Sulfotelmatobacter sp.]
MTSLNSVRWGLVLLASIPVCAQEQSSAPAPAVSNPVISVSTNSDSSGTEGRMLAPPPVSGQSYPVAFASEERANYLRGGVTFNTAYSDNVLGGDSVTPVSDVSYSVWPTISLDETTSRLHTVLSYAPGFTFYQRVTSRNEADENLALDLQYRLSPHVTVSVRDSFQKSSDVFNQPDEGLAGAVSGSTEGVNNSIIAPLADRLSNTGNAGITYQFAANAMVGASGTFTNLHYPNPDEVPGLFDAASRGGAAFYSYRIAREHYIGVTYQYQQLLSYPTGGTNETQTDGIFAFYSYYPAHRFSFSLFGGPQYYSAGVQFTGTIPATVAAEQSWSPAGGASLNWQAQHSSIAVSYLHSISGGGGLVGAVKLDSANASVRQQLTRNVSAALAGTYANNGVLALSDLGGHLVSGSASLGRQVGEHLNLQAGYTRLYQTYSVFSANPDANREWVSISYQFARPLGR